MATLAQKAQLRHSRVTFLRLAFPVGINHARFEWIAAQLRCEGPRSDAKVASDPVAPSRFAPSRPTSVSSALRNDPTRLFISL
jgi:hypothetical protein